MDGVPTIPGYRVEGVLGEGAMGVVYRATQFEPIRREVALKVVKAGVDSPQVLARFENERRTLARMEHPGIARIFDAGLTGDGRPWFAMEIVRGTPLVEWCDAHRLPVPGRLRLFVTVCRAVQHAHQKGIIHRDLKPSNILVSEVDGSPVPRVIDFGIAKAVDPLGIDDAGVTRDEQVVGSPAYMSPEQVDGAQDIDTRTDIYALGIVLYELLVGALPFDAGAYRGWAAIVKALATDVPTPSRRLGTLADTQVTIAAARGTTPAHLRRTLSGDLDWIVARATERDRERRYETANGMALDIERYLDDIPIRAHGATAAYRAGKFIRRHRWGVGFAATVAVGLVGFAGVTSVQNARIADARDLAQARQGQAEGLIGFMIGDLATRLDDVGRLDMMDTVAIEALAYFDAVDPEELSDEELFRRAQAIQQIGEVRADRGDWASAAETFRAALEEYRTLAARDPARSEWQLGLGEGLFYVAFAHRSLGNGDSALAYFQDYRDVAVRNAELHPDDAVWQRELASTATNLALQRRSNGDLDGVVDALRGALRAKEAIFARDTSDAQAKYDVAQGWYNLGVALGDVGDVAGSAEAYAEDVRLKRELLVSDPLNARYRTRLVSALGRAMDALVDAGRAGNARDLADEAVELAMADADADPGNVTRRAEAAAIRMIASRTDHPRADEWLDVSIAEFDAVVRDSPGETTSRASLSRALRLRSLRSLDAADVAGAARDAERAVAVLDDVDEAEYRVSDRVRMADALLILGDIRARQGRTAESDRAWERARALLAPYQETRDPEARAIIDALGSRGITP